MLNYQYRTGVYLKNEVSKVILSDKKGIRQIIIFDDRNSDVFSQMENKTLKDCNLGIIVKQWIMDEYRAS
jgi:hypothetical protein